MAFFQHKHNKGLRMVSIVDLAANALKECHGESVACVLMNAAEVTIFDYEVTSTNATPVDRLAVLGDPQGFWDDRQSNLWLINYTQLRGILVVPGAGPKDDLTLLLHMGCGEYTWDIVEGCHDLWKWALGFEDEF